MYCLSVFESGLLCNVNNKRTIADKDAAAKRGEQWFFSNHRPDVSPHSPKLYFEYRSPGRGNSAWHLNAGFGSLTPTNEIKQYHTVYIGLPWVVHISTVPLRGHQRTSDTALSAVDSRLPCARCCSSPKLQANVSLTS